jgi:hypothetical protein
MSTSGIARPDQRNPRLRPDRTPPHALSGRRCLLDLRDRVSNCGCFAPVDDHLGAQLREPGGSGEPMPRVEPVTSASFPVRSRFMRCFPEIPVRGRGENKIEVEQRTAIKGSV